jgi:hypothetical protein
MSFHRKEEMMCCHNYFAKFPKLIMKAIMDATLREQFLADPMGTAREFGLSDTELKELAMYDLRKLRAFVQGPAAHS